MKYFIFLCLSIVSLSFSVSQAEFQVNIRTTYNQTYPDVAMDGAGNFVVVWRSYRQDGDSGGIFAQLFGDNCQPLSEEFQVNNIITGDQTKPSVAIDSAGNFVVVWQEPDSIEENSNDIFARRFDTNAQPLCDDFCVNENTQANNLCPKVDMNTKGNYVVVWECEDISGQGNSAICGRLYNSDGSSLSEEIVINEASANCRYPDVAIDNFGNFAVVWIQGRLRDYSIFVRQYNSNGTAKSIPFQVNTIGLSSLTKPSIAMTDDGYFIIAWDGDPDRASLDDIHARLYHPDGTPAGEQFIVNITREGEQQWPQVAMNNQQEFVIVWDSRIDPNVNERDIFGQRYNSLGQPIGDEFCINTYIIDDQRYPVVAIKDNGEFITAWQSYGQDGSHYGIFAEIGHIFEPADFTGDGFVNFYDYCVLAEEWLKNENSLKADLIDDHKIDERDLAAFCEQWLNMRPQKLEWANKLPILQAKPGRA